MAEFKLLSRLTDDNTELVMEMHRDGQAVGHLQVTPAEVEILIRHLSDQREKMNEEVPRDLDVGTRLVCTKEPIFRVEADPDGVILALRHPGIGWLGFLLSPPLAAVLAVRLGLQRTS